MAVAPEGNIRIKAFETTTPAVAVATEDYVAPVDNPLAFTLTVPNPVPHIVKIYDSPGEADGTLLADFLYDPSYSTIDVKADKVYIVGSPDAPEAGATQYEDDDLEGYTYELERRGVGTLVRQSEWDYLDDPDIGFKLLNENDAFQADETIILHFYPKISIVTPDSGDSGSTKFIADIVAVTADTTLDDTYYNKLVSIASSTSKITLTLPAISGVPNTTPISFTTCMGSQINAVIKTSGTDSIFWGSEGRSAMYMGKNEQLLLIKGTDGWYVINAAGGYDQVGRQFYADMVLPNTVERKGQLLLRAEYPRLFNDYVQKLPPAMIVSESTWSSDATTNRGKFTLGDGSTNFRIPDARGLFIRNLDSGRGIDSGRAAGTYQADMVGPHTHDVPMKEVGGISNNPNGGGVGDKDRPYGTSDDATYTTDENSGTETRGKNEAKIALIAV